MRRQPLDRDRLIAMMVGRELTQLFPKDNTPTDRVALSVRSLSLNGIFSDVSFDVRAGEIFGIAGLVGSRRTEVAETIFGLRRATSGEILIDGVPADIDSPAAAIRRGMAFLTEDRKASGLFLPLSVQENMEVTVLDGRFVNRGFVKQASAASRRAAPWPTPCSVKTPDLGEAGSESQRRQPAEGPGGPLAVDVSAHPDPR